jgi:V/A-type H+-transporting ATPase subunit C
MSNYASITKSKNLFGQLLCDEDFKNLIMFDDLNSVIDYFKNRTAYGDRLTILDSRNVLYFENQIKKAFFKYYGKFYHYFINEDKDLFKALFLRYEVENLKLYVRNAIRLKPMENLKDEILITDLYSNLNYELLSLSVDLNTLIESLHGTPYQKIIKKYADQDDEKKLFYIEMSLDRHYFKQLSKAISNLSDKNKIPLIELLGVNSDLLNIQWIYRGRKYFNLSPEELFNYCLESGKKVKNEYMKKLCYIDDFEELKREVQKTKYEYMFADNDIMVERNMERIIFKLIDTLIIKNWDSIIVPIGYLHKLEYEMRDIFTVFEAIRYGEKNIENYLVRTL